MQYIVASYICFISLRMESRSNTLTMSVGFNVCFHICRCDSSTEIPSLGGHTHTKTRAGVLCMCLIKYHAYMTYEAVEVGVQVYAFLRSALLAGESSASWPNTVAARSSLTRTLGSWVRIPFKAWISVCVYSVCR
jgi:hypothetical protein